jgi:uncharacterized OB-fold protein
MDVRKRPDRTLGPGHDEFWQQRLEGRLCLQRCDVCNELAWPVVKACEHCDSTDLPFKPLSGRGKVISWATFERDYYLAALPIPWDTILVELEEGPLFISNPHGFSWPDISANMPVRVAFIDVEDSAGPFRLPVFEKL